MPAHLTYIKRMVQGRFAQRFLKNKNKKLKCNLACVAGVFLAEESKRTAKRPLPHSSRNFAARSSVRSQKNTRRQLCREMIRLTIWLTYKVF